MPPSDIAVCHGTRPPVINASALRRELRRIGSVLAAEAEQHSDHEPTGAAGRMTIEPLLGG